MQETEEQNDETPNKDAIMAAADFLYHAKIHAFIVGFTVALFMIGIAHLFVLMALS